MSKADKRILTPGTTPAQHINCRCVLVLAEPCFGKQLDLFGRLSPATLSYEDLIKEIKK